MCSFIGISPADDGIFSLVIDASELFGKIFIVSRWFILQKIRIILVCFKTVSYNNCELIVSLFIQSPKRSRSISNQLKNMRTNMNSFHLNEEWIVIGSWISRQQIVTIKLVDWGPRQMTFSMSSVETRLLERGMIHKHTFDWFFVHVAATHEKLGMFRYPQTCYGQWTQSRSSLWNSLIVHSSNGQNPHWVYDLSSRNVNVLLIVE